MPHLSFTGVSDDGARLRMVDESGVEFSLDVTSRVRSALRSDATRPSTLESPMESTLRPRDIQARIRAGETPEVVAEAARTSVDKIMAFVGPVLAERQHIADRGQWSHLRRPAGETGGGRSLGNAVEAHLRSLNIDPTEVDWDAWRREDGRWTLSATFKLSARSGVAHFTYDTPGNYVVLDDDDARWLVGDTSSFPAAATPAPDDLQYARTRRLAAVADDELPLGDDAIELVADEPAGPATDDVEPSPDTPLEAFPEESPSTDALAARHDAAEAPADDQPDFVDEVLDVPEEAPTRRPVQKKKGRASVPSWDEIMFGGGDQA